MAKIAIKEGDKVEVQWLDIVTASNWKTRQARSTAKPAVCKSVGFFINQDKDSIRISHSVSDDNGGDYTVFPIGCVTRIRRLR